MKFSPSKNQSHFEAMFKQNGQEWRLKPDTELVESLSSLSMEMDFDAIDEKYQTILYLAVANNRPKTVAYLLTTRKVNPNVKVIEQLTAAHVAAATGNMEVLKLLVACSNIQLDDQDKYGETPLFRAIGNAPDETVLEAVKLILAASPASISIANEDGVFPLDIALEKEHLPIIKLLLQNGANVSKQCQSVAAANLMDQTVPNSRFPEAMFFHIDSERKNNLKDCAKLIIDAYNAQPLADDVKALAMQRSSQTQSNSKTIVQSCSDDLERIFPSVKGKTVLYENHGVVDVAVKTDEETVVMRDYLKNNDIDVQKGKNTITKIFTIRLKANEDSLNKLKAIPVYGVAVSTTSRPS